MYLKPDRVDQMPEVRLKYLKRYTSLLKTFQSIEKLLSKEPASFKPGMISTLIEVIGDLQLYTTLGEANDFDEEDPLNLIKLRSSFAFLKIELEEIAQHIGERDLRSNCQAIAELC